MIATVNSRFRQFSTPGRGNSPALWFLLGRRRLNPFAGSLEGHRPRNTTRAKIASQMQGQSDRLIPFQSFQVASPNIQPLVQHLIRMLTNRGSRVS
jgi:hypothetical protein